MADPGAPAEELGSKGSAPAVKLKAAGVTHLRTALKEKGLDTKGMKPTLIERLKEAFKEENELDKIDQDEDNTQIKDCSDQKGDQKNLKRLM